MTMNAKEFVQRHKKLEQDISNAVTKLVSDYENEIGAPVRDIEIDAVDVTRMGDDFTKYIRRASVKLDLSE